MNAKFLRLILDVEAVIYLLLITCITVPLNLEYIIFITLLTTNHYYSKLELRFSDEAMEKYKQISDEHAHEFNTTQEMRPTQELVDEDSGTSIMERSKYPDY